MKNIIRNFITDRRGFIVEGFILYALVASAFLIVAIPSYMYIKGKAEELKQKQQATIDVPTPPTTNEAPPAAPEVKSALDIAVENAAAKEKERQAAEDKRAAFGITPGDPPLTNAVGDCFPNEEEAACTARKLKIWNELPDTGLWNFVWNTFIRPIKIAVWDAPKLIVGRAIESGWNYFFPPEALPAPTLVKTTRVCESTKKVIPVEIYTYSNGTKKSVDLEICPLIECVPVKVIEYCPNYAKYIMFEGFRDSCTQEVISGNLRDCPTQAGGGGGTEAPKPSGGGSTGGTTAPACEDLSEQLIQAQQECGRTWSDSTEEVKARHEQCIADFWVIADPKTCQD